jgi:hypothetical protein
MEFFTLVLLPTNDSLSAQNTPLRRDDGGLALIHTAIAVQDHPDPPELVRPRSV